MLLRLLVLLPHVPDHLLFGFGFHCLLLGLHVAHLLVLGDLVRVLLLDVEVHLSALVLLLD